MGETILIGKNGQASAMPVQATEAAPRKKHIGILAGKLHVPEDFDSPLPDADLAAFEDCSAG